MGRKRFEALARPALPEEREALWALLESSYRYYADYRDRTRREIPIVILTPQHTEGVG